MSRFVAAVAVAVAVAVAACVPSRAAMFDPVADAVRTRTGIVPVWRDGWRRSANSEQRVRAILGAALTADAAATVAVLSHPALQAAYADLAAAGGAVATARALPNPRVEAALRFSRDDGPDQLELEATLSLSELVLAIPRARAADADLRAARRRAVQATVAIASRARRALYAAVAAEQRQAMRRLIAEAAAASAELARGLHAAGNVSDLTLAREELFEEEAALAVTEAEAEAIRARSELDAALGAQASDPPRRLAAALPEPPSAAPGVADLERETIAASLELDALRWQIEAAGRRIGAARLSSLIPGVGAGVSAEREDEWAVGPAVTVSLPLLDWGQGRRASAWADLRARQHDYTAAALSARAAARIAAARVIAAHARVTRIRTRVLPIREKLLDQALRQYNAMNLDAFELLVIRREHTASEEQYVDALRELWIAQTEVDQLRAGSLPGAQIERRERAVAPGTEDGGH